MLRTIKSAMFDFSDGIGRWEVWVALAREDIGDQHRRTTLGPIWLLINYFAYAATFIFVFHRDSAGVSNAGYVAIGLLVWFYMMETISLSVSLFTREESFIKGTTLPLSVYVMRLAMQSTIRSTYALIGCVTILAFSGAEPSVIWLWSLVGILVILLTTPAVIVVLAFVGAYFPDSQFIVNNLMRLGMFLTPVFWKYDGDSRLHGILYTWNPFTYFIEAVRDPIVSNLIPANALLTSAVIGLVVWLLAILTLGRLRKRVVFVL